MKIRYYLEKRDPEFAKRMAEVLGVYRKVTLLKKAAARLKRKPNDRVAIVSYDEKPGIQAIATTSPDLPPEPDVHATFARDHDYKRHGTVARWPASTLSPATFTPWSGPAAAASLSRSSSVSTKPVRPILRSTSSSTIVPRISPGKPTPGSLSNRRTASSSPGHGSCERYSARERALAFTIHFLSNCVPLGEARQRCPKN